MGLRRQLSATEILEQVVVAKRLAHEWSAHRAARIHLRNVVFMGMGEPLHNEQPVHEALSFLISDKGFGFSPRHITLSTVGVPDKMVAAARKFPRLRIALSLHAADQELRRRLVPRATHDLPSLREAIAQINAIDPAGPVWIEYTLLAGVNDSEAHARQLADFCHGLRVEINVIPCNDIAHANVPSGERIANHGYHPPEAVAQRAFVRVLREAGYFTTLRNTLGQSIQAACGQLIWNSSG
jgi:23S rRNA (adenine2503-C2)-methyltransferase